MLMIRFQRIGRTNDPAFRIVLTEKERAAKAGAIVAQLGTYNPKSKAFSLDEAKTKDWMSKGAQLTPSIHNLLITKGIIEGKKINVLPKKTVPKKEEPAAEATAAEAAPTAEAAVASEAPAAEPEPAKEEAPVEAAPEAAVEAEAPTA